MGTKPDLSPIGTIKLIDLPRALNTASNGTAGATYPQCYMAAANGTIPAYRSNTGTRWLVNKADLPQIIETFSLERANSHDQDQSPAKDVGKAHKAKRRPTRDHKS